LLEVPIPEEKSGELFFDAEDSKDGDLLYVCNDRVGIGAVEGVGRFTEAAKLVLIERRYVEDGVKSGALGSKFDRTIR
jgi:hypothetical protein